MRTTNGTRKALSTARRSAVRLLAVLGLVSLSFMFLIVAADALGLITSEPMGSPDDPPPSESALEGAEAPGEVVHVLGALSVVAIGGSGLIALIVRPERSGSAYQVLAAALAVIVAVLLVGNPDNYGGQAGAIDPAFLILVLPALAAAAASRPWRSWASTPPRNVKFLAVAATGALPGGWFGVGQALMQRDTFPPSADPHHQAHWFAMAAFAFMVILVVATGSLSAPGSRLATGAGGLGAVSFGLGCLIARDAASAVAPAWAVTTVVWGLAVLWLTGRESQRMPVATGPT